MTKHVVVTGAAGLLGRPVTDAYREAGFRVTALDRVAEAQTGVIAADLTDPAIADTLIAEADCVAHIAALPRPVGYAAPDVFHTNMTLMFNVLTAMERAGIPRLVYASSFSILGLPFAPMPVDIRYLPIDEEHPAQPQDVYAVTKWLGEEMADAWVRRTGNTAVSLRMPWIQTPERFFTDVGERRLTDEARLDLWAYIDARDAGEAFVTAADAPSIGHERLFIAADDSYSETETAALVARFYPDVEHRSELSGHRGLLSNDRARDILGFAPKHSWRDYPLPGPVA